MSFNCRKLLSWQQAKTWQDVHSWHPTDSTDQDNQIQWLITRVSKEQDEPFRQQSRRRITLKTLVSGPEVLARVSTESRATVPRYCWELCWAQKWSQVNQSSRTR
jgi:hypothetical protein